MGTPTACSPPRRGLLWPPLRVTPPTGLPGVPMKMPLGEATPWVSLLIIQPYILLLLRPFVSAHLCLLIFAKSLCICLLVHSLPPCVLVHLSHSVSQSVTYSQPCSASCVCLYYECQPMPSACAKVSMKETLHDLPDAQETCCEVKTASRTDMIAVQTCQRSAVAKVLQPFGIGLGQNAVQPCSTIWGDCPEALLVSVLSVAASVYLHSTPSEVSLQSQHSPRACLLVMPYDVNRKLN